LCYQQSREDLWLDTDKPDKLNEKVNIMNYLKQKFSPKVASVRKEIRRSS